MGCRRPDRTMITRSRRARAPRSADEAAESHGYGARNPIIPLDKPGENSTRTT